MDHQGETALARALLAGQPEAFEKFVEHFRAKLFHYSWLMCGQPNDAEEVAQETLLKVFESIGQLRDPEHVRSWIFRIARNVCLMRRRKSIFAPAQELSLDELMPVIDTPGDSPLPETSVLDSELRAVLHRAILELPPSYRSVVVLRDMEELSTEDTAQILDLTTDVVKTRLHRGRAAMRQKLDCYMNNHCMEGQPAPDPTPLSPAEKEELYSEWRKAIPA